jgi:glycerol uptake facilitator-like aquaporin
LIANTLATVFALFVLIEIFGLISGAHFNPLVTLVSYFKSKTNNNIAVVFIASTAILFIAFQCLGAITGCVIANSLSHENA